jgi:putative ABC transport system substrate-binding protein
MDHWGRRQFVQSVGVAGLGLVAGCGRLPGQQQSQARPSPTRRIGYLSLNAESGDVYRGAFLQGLHDLGWVEGQNLAIEYRYAAGAAEQLPVLAAELVGSNIELLVATPATSDVAKQATTSLPVVAIHADPVGGRLVASLAHPGGNITGLGFIAPELAGKRLELLKGAFPGASRIAAMWNPTNAAMSREYGETRVAADALGVELQPLPVRDLADIESAFDAATQEHTDAVVVIVDTLLVSQRARVVELAAQRGLPAVYSSRLLVDAGGLIAYSPSMSDVFRRAATYVDKILKGAQPADLPVELPMRFELVINVKTARALGITFPNEILLQATEIIQ